MKNIAIIPARSGSKGLKDKNIKLLNGKPLMAYTIEAAIESKQFSEVHVSTDSKKYAKIAEEYGANVPFLRSEELSSDSASTWDTVLFVLEKYKQIGKEYDTFAVLQPTSPLRTAQDIRKAYEMYERRNAKSVVSICEMEHSPLWSNTLDENGTLDNFIPKELLSRRQELPTYYRLNGAIYISDVWYFMEKRTLYHDKGVPYIMTGEASVDIDNIIDFELVKVLMKKYKKRGCI